MVGVIKTESLLISFASFSVTQMYGHAEQSICRTQFGVHKGGFIVPMPLSLTEEASSVTFTRLNTVCGFNSFVSLLASTQSAKINFVHYVVDEFPFLGHDFETGADHDISAIRAGKLVKKANLTILDVPSHGVA